MYNHNFNSICILPLSMSIDMNGCILNTRDCVVVGDAGLTHPRLGLSL